MIILEVCTKYRHLLEVGKTYTGTEFAAIVKSICRKSAKVLKNSPILFTRYQEKGIELKSLNLFL